MHRYAQCQVTKPRWGPPGRNTVPGVRLVAGPRPLCRRTYTALSMSLFAHLWGRDATLHPASLGLPVTERSTKTPTMCPAPRSQETSLDKCCKEVFWPPQHLRVAGLCHRCSHLVTVRLFIYPRHGAHFGGRDEAWFEKGITAKASTGPIMCLHIYCSYKGLSMLPNKKV